METTPTTPVQEPYKPDAIDYNRVDQRANEGYYREYWSSYKGRVRGMLAGVIVGGAFGAAIGLAVAATAGLAALPLMAAFAGVTAFIGADTYGSAGSAAASRAAGLAERHARVLDPAYKNDETAALNDKLMMDGRGHHFQFPADRDKGKWFNWKSGTLGAALGAGLGVLLAGSGIAAKIAFLTPILGATPAIAATAVAFAALGASFGIDRSNLKDVFNQIDFLGWGKLRGKQHHPDLGQAQFASESEKQLAEHRLQRQASTFALEEEYHTKIYSRAVKGLFRGLAGGAVAGALIGAGIGLVAFAAAAGLAAIPALAGVGALEAVVGAGALASATAFASVGTLYGIKAFSDAGREAGAESMARAIDNEFEHNLELRQKGIQPVKSLPPEEKFINVKAGLMMAAVGAGVGLLAPALIGTGVLTAAGIHVAAMSGMGLATSAAAGGLFGAMYGIGGDSIRRLSKVTDWVYDKSYVVHNDPTLRPYVKPLPAQEEVLKEKLAEKHSPSVTHDDVKKMEERMNQRPQKNFEQAVLAQAAQQSAPLLYKA